MTTEKVTYEEWVHWDDKVWRSRLNTLSYPADYEDDWVLAENSFPPDAYVRVEERPGPHWTQQVRNDHFNKLQQFLSNGEKWILVEPFVVSDTAGRWIVLGNFLHKTSLYSGLFSLFVCIFFRHKTKLRWTTAIASTIFALCYTCYARDPISSYRVVSNKLELSRFPMKSFYPMKPRVFRRVRDFPRCFAHWSVALSSLAYGFYYMRFPSPFCYCGWSNLEKFRPDPVQVMDSTRINPLAVDL